MWKYNMPTQIQAFIFRTAHKTWNHSSQSCALCLNRTHFPGQLMTQWSVLQCNTIISKLGGLIFFFFSGCPEEQLNRLTFPQRHPSSPPPPTIGIFCLMTSLASYAWWLHRHLMPDDFTGILCQMTSLETYAWWLHRHLMPDDFIGNLCLMTSSAPLLDDFIGIVCLMTSLFPTGPAKWVFRSLYSSVISRPSLTSLAIFLRLSVRL